MYRWPSVSLTNSHKKEEDFDAGIHVELSTLLYPKWKSVEGINANAASFILNRKLIC